MCRFLEMIELPSTTKLILMDICKQNWTLLVAQQLESWESIRHEVNHLLQGEKDKVREYLLKYFNQDLLG